MTRRKSLKNEESLSINSERGIVKISVEYDDMGRVRPVYTVPNTMDSFRLAEFKLAHKKEIEKFLNRFI